MHRRRPVKVEALVPQQVQHVRPDPLRGRPIGQCQLDRADGQRLIRRARIHIQSPAVLRDDDAGECRTVPARDLITNNNNNNQSSSGDVAESAVVQLVGDHNRSLGPISVFGQDQVGFASPWVVSVVGVGSVNQDDDITILLQATALA